MAEAVSGRLPLTYLPFAWSGLVLAAIVLVALGLVAGGDPGLLLRKWSISFDAFIMTVQEVGLLAGLIITLRLLSRRGVGVRDLGVRGGFKVS